MSSAGSIEHWRRNERSISVSGRTEQSFFRLSARHRMPENMSGSSRVGSPIVVTRAFVDRFCFRWLRFGLRQ